MSDTDEPFANWSDPMRTHLQKVQSRKSKHTLKNRKVSLKQWQQYCDDEETAITDADPELLDDWLDKLNTEGYGGKVIKNKFYDLSAFYKFAGQRGYIDEEFIASMEEIDLDWINTDPIINQHVEARYLEIDEYKRLLDACETLCERLLIRFLWSTGARAIEASRCKISDIDRENREVELKTAKQGKGEFKDRTVFYRRDLERDLKEWIDRGGRKRYMGSARSPFLFVTRESPMMRQQRISEIVHDVSVRAGLNEKIEFFDEDEMEIVELTTVDGRPRYQFSTHSLRHSYAVHRTKNGMPIVYLQELMGHSDIEQTRFYLQFREDDLQEADQKYAPRF